MASETTGTPKMIVPYEWILGNVGEEPMTIASKMIWFRGEKVFRVGLKNHTLKPVLFFMAIDLGKIGMKVEDVKCGIQGSGIGPTKMKGMTKKDIGDEGSLQLFTIDLAEKFVGNCTFSFRICIEGTDSGYSYQLCDRLAKDQLSLWAAPTVKDEKNLSDVEFVVKDKTFPAHKAILAARSPVFAHEFEKVHLDVPHQIRIDDVEPSTVENFLHFIYTGEPMGTLADEGLLKLANKYGLLALSGLCQVALNKEIEAAMQMTKVIDILNSRVVVLSSSKIMPEKDTEMFFDGTTTTFRCAFEGLETGQPKCLMQLQKEEIFFAYFTGNRKENSNPNNGFTAVTKPFIHLSCAKHRRFGLKVEDIYCGTKEIPKGNMAGYGQWLKMESEKLKENANILLRFIVQLELDFYCGNSRINKLTFDIKTVSTIGNYYYEMMDDAWFANFWFAALHQKMTDVEIFVGTVKLMEAHRVILSARSPVLNESLNKINNTAEKSIVTFGAEFDKDIVYNFLNFLYTGRLETCARSKQLRKLATVYEVETLKNICQLINANPPDVEELTNCLIQL